jgi:hypothetical protein
MRRRLVAAATVAAFLSIATAMAMDQNSQTGGESTTGVKSHPAIPVAIKATPISIELNLRDQKRAALAALLLIGATAPCLRAEGNVFIPHNGC